ncbi:MAG: hypothetical protein AAGB48_11075 [Planctomycetota bacterium]
MRFFSFALLIATGASSAGAQPLTILDLVPDNAAVVVGVDSVDEARAAFDRTAIKREWWDSDGVQSWVEEQLQQASEEFRDKAADLELNLDDLELPTGMAGAAMWLPEELNDDGSARQWEYLVAADFGEHIDATQEALDDLIVHAEESGNAWFEEEPFAGGTIWTLELPDAQEELEEWERNEQPPVDTEQLFIATHGSHLMVTSDLRQVETALERLAGEGRGDASARSASEVTSALAAAGGTGHGYAVANFRPLIDLVGRMDDAAEDGAAGMGMKITDILKAVGLYTARSMAMNIEFDGDDGMLESGFAVMLPEKQRLLSLMDPPAAPFTPPGYVTADASSVSLFHFDFARLFPVVNEIISDLPEEAVQDIRPQLQMAQGFLEPMLSQLGPKIYVVSRISRPFSATSQRTLVAIECADTQALGRSIQQLASMFGANLDQRPFQSGVIYDLEAPGFAPGSGNEFSIGLSTGAILIGDIESVEVALRLGGNGGEGTLAADKRFRDAIPPQSGLSFGYSQMREAIEYAAWTVENTNTATTPMEVLPPLNTLADVVGDFVSVMQSTPEGYIGRSLVLRPN